MRSPFNVTSVPVGRFSASANRIVSVLSPPPDRTDEVKVPGSTAHPATIRAVSATTTHRDQFLLRPITSALPRAVP